jgi:ubiquinone/menaquinone biosynthesis C-methylase UbiE/Co/Zn/Cd efflux system component
MEQFFRLAPWGFPRQILMILADDAKTFPEILEGFARFMYHFGHFGREEFVVGYTAETFTAAVQAAIEKLEQEGVVVQNGEVYNLSTKGQQQAQKHQQQYQELGRFVESSLHPQTASLVSLGVHIVLATLKLIAGAISGSIGMISDGIDTALDGLSSVLVFVGLRLKKETVVNVVLVLLMLGVGIGTGYEAVSRLFVPEVVQADLLTFATSILSGLVCLLLSYYQRYVATRSGQQALITQAVDSQNHAIVAAGVIAGLVATLLRFPLLDTLVGLAVAALILKNGVELTLEMVRTLRGEEMDFARYELGFVEVHREFQQQQLADWLLYLIAEDGPLTRPALLTRCREPLDARDVPILRELGWGKGVELEKKVTGTLETLVAQGLVAAEDGLQVTEKGRAELIAEGWGVEEVEFYVQAMEPRTRYVHAPLARRILQNLPSLQKTPFIVDVGSGPGFLCFELAKLLPGATFLGVDPSPHAIEKALLGAVRAGVERFEARRGRAEQFPVDSDSADLVISRESLHEWEDVPAASAEIYRVLKPGGFLALEDLNRASARWKRTLFVLLTGLGTNFEITRTRLRSYQTAFTMEEAVELLERSGFEILESEADLSLFILAAKK